MTNAMIEKITTLLLEHSDELPPVVKRDLRDLLVLASLEDAKKDHVVE